MIEFENNGFVYTVDDRDIKSILFTDVNPNSENFGCSFMLEVRADRIVILPYVFNDPKRDLFKLEFDKKCLVYEELKSLTRFSIDSFAHINNPQIFDEQNGKNNMRLVNVTNGTLKFGFKKAPNEESFNVTLFKANNESYYNTIKNATNKMIDKLVEYYNGLEK